MNLNEMLKNMSKEDFEKNIKKAQEFMNTPEGRNIAEKLNVKSGSQPSGNLSGVDKTKLLNELSKNPDILKKIEKLMKG